MTQTLLSIGHGFSARAIGRLVQARGWRVIATTRSEQKAADMQSEGIDAVVWPGSDLSPYIAQASHILTSVAPNEDGDPVLAECSEALRGSDAEWVGYLSTTGVYGDHQGGWVDEETPLNPSTKRGKYRQKAEAAWLELGLPLHIFRLAGIYGPGRGPFSKVRAGTARRIIKKDQVFSRIHVEDIAAVVLASIDRPNAGSVYNVCDDMAAPPEDVIAYAAELLGLPIPPDEDFWTAEMTPMARSFYSESKKVSNERIKTELGVELAYPDYKSGLQALMRLEDRNHS